MSGENRNYDGRKSQKWDDNFDIVSSLYYSSTAPQALQTLVHEYGFDITIYIYQNKITEWQKTGRLEPKNSKKPKRLIEAEIPVDNETNHDEETIIGIYRGCSLGSLTKINVDWTKRTPIGDMIQGICLRQDAEQHQDLQKLKPGLVVDGLPEARTLALEHFIHRALCQHSTDNNLKRPTNLSSLFNSALSPPVVRYIQNIEWMKQYVSAEKIDTIVARMLETMKLHRTVELAGCQAKARVHLSIIREIREEIWELLVSIFHPDRKISTLQFKWAQELIRQLDTTYYYEFHGRRSRNVLQMVWKALEDQLQVSPMVYEEIQAVCLRSCCQCGAGPYLDDNHVACIEPGCQHKFCLECEFYWPRIRKARVRTC